MGGEEKKEWKKKNFYVQRGRGVMILRLTESNRNQSIKPPAM
jgi:hypothetical protein